MSPLLILLLSVHFVLPDIRESAGRGKQQLVVLGVCGRHDEWMGVTFTVGVSPQTQRSLRESQAALLQRVEELTDQLKQERQRALELEGLLTTSNMSLQTLDKVQVCLQDQDQTNERHVSRFIWSCFRYKRGSQTWKEKET